MWTVETLNIIVDAEIENLPADMRARLVRYATLIEQFGLRGVQGGDKTSHWNAGVVLSVAA